MFMLWRGGIDKELTDSGNGEETEDLLLAAVSKSVIMLEEERLWPANTLAFVQMRYFWPFFFFFAWRILDILVYYMLHNWIHWDHYKDLCSWCHFLNSKWIKKMALNDWRQQQEDSYWHNVFVIDLNSIDLRNFGILCRCRLANDVNMRWSMMKQLFVCFRGWDLMFIAWANTSINVWISMFRRSQTCHGPLIFCSFVFIPNVMIHGCSRLMASF